MEGAAPTRDRGHSGGDPVGAAQRDPVPLPPRGSLSGTGIQGVPGAAGGHTPPERPHPERRGGQGGEPYTQGRAVGTRYSLCRI